uniref:Apoptotic protease-activating factor 1 n=1 Tax=Schistosoma haematobium TaxID=6185 RepID=A0A095A402_SCHHA
MFQVCGILWAIPEDKAERILSIYTRYSLTVRHWIYKVGNCGYTIHGIQLDLLKSCIDPVEQANYHAKFIQNYFTFCGGRWLKLVSSWEHIYFWNNATEHLFKAAQLDKLVDLLINLDFLRGRLKIIGTTPVIADFQRYRAVFVTLNRMAEWLAYLRFIQTNAYYIIDPTIVQDCERSRSPCQGSRRSSVANLDLSPPNFRPDSRCISPVESRRNLFSRNIRSNSINIPDHSSYNTTSPKGIDLLQLGLGLSQDNPVFQQAFQLLTERHQSVLKMNPSSKEEVSKTLSIVRAFKYYWFWCNSHIAASQLLWAIPTGFQAVTCLAIEVPYTISSAFTNVPTDDSTDTVSTDNQEDLANDSRYLYHNRYRKRYLASTSDGRVLLLDANSGYEVALHQVYSPEIEVKFLSFLSNNTECLTCGSNGSLVISTLPVAEQISGEEFYPYDKIVSNHENGTFHFDYYGNHRDSCNLDAIGSDDDDVSINNGFIDSKHSSQYSTRENINIYLESNDSEVSTEGTIRRRKRSTIVSPVYDSSPIDVPTPTVLADLPRLTELARVDNAQSTTLPITSQNVHCHSISRSLCSVYHNSSFSLDYDSCNSSLFVDMMYCVGFSKTTYNILTQLIVLVKQIFLFQLPNQISSESTYQLQCIAANSSLDLLIMTGEGCLDSVSHRVDGIESSTYIKTTPKLPNVYHLKRGSGGKLRLDCSRELRLPCLPSDHWYPQLCTDSNSKVHLASVSENGNIIAVCLSDGFIWFYNLEIICWISCISTKLSIDFVTKFLSQRFSIDVFEEYERLQLFDANTVEVGVGPAASCVIFLPSFTNHGNPNDMNNAPIFFAASLSTQVLIWCLPNTEFQFSESRILENETLCRNSFPRLHLLCSCASTVLSMDARIIEGQCILAGGTASGRVLFLFRPKQLNNNGNNNNETCSFQEITIRPSQSSYWNPQVQHTYIEVDSCESIDHQNHKNSLENNHEPSSSIESSKKPLPFKHWILSTGLSSSMYGVATAVSFWNDGNWVYSLHFDDSQLYGIVKRYYLLASDHNLNKTNNEEKKYSSSSLSFSTLYDRILHLHTWMHEDCTESIDSKDCKVLIVAWYLSDACHKISNPTIPCVNIYPTECFPKNHSDIQSLNGSVHDQKIKSDVQTGYMNDAFPNNNNSVVTWSTCRLIERSQHPFVCDYRTRSLKRRSSLDKKENKMLVWFTSGRDGRVFGRELFLPGDNRSVTVNEENKSGVESDRWKLDLDAHTPMTITNADISLSGHWLVTGSADKTAKVWLLPSGTLAFDTGMHPMCVRSVAFQPVVELDDELIMVTGDDEGTLRVWRLTAQIPDPVQRFSSRSGYLNDNRLFNKRPDYYSTAAGYGSTWLHKLTWSPDGRLLAGLSDRLCVWPFESTQQFDLPNNDSNDSSDNTNSPVHLMRRVSVQDKLPTLNPPKFEIQQCRVLRVLSSGACNLTGTSPPLMVSPSRLLELNSNDKNYGTVSSIDLPPTIVTVDSNTGTLYIFDPIGSLF